MREILEAANQDLLHQIEMLQDLFGKAQVVGELTPYVAGVLALCEEMRQRARDNLDDLKYGLENTFIDTLQTTQTLSQYFELVNTRLAAPIVRSKPEDRLALIVLRWLHDLHPQTKPVPFGFTDGNFAVYPTTDFPPVYFLPVSRQRTLLYLPLFFHEFGHVLYALHKEEMEELVKEFQKAVSDHLSPLTIRDRLSTSQSDSYRRSVISAWFSWLQELYCDAVGVTIGGPCYLEAFSHFFRTRSEEQYYLPRSKQITRSHPNTWLRAKIMSEHSHKLGLDNLGDEIKQTWQKIADTLSINEDYEGTWNDKLFNPLRQALDDMLVESQPRHYTREDIEVPSSTEYENPVRLFNLAWAQFKSTPKTYARWEREHITKFLSLHL